MLSCYFRLEIATEAFSLFTGIEARNWQIAERLLSFGAPAHFFIRRVLLGFSQLYYTSKRTTVDKGRPSLFRSFSSLDLYFTKWCLQSLWVTLFFRSTYLMISCIYLGYTAEKVTSSQNWLISSMNCWVKGLKLLCLGLYITSIKSKTRVYFSVPGRQGLGATERKGILSCSPERWRKKAKYSRMKQKHCWMVKVDPPLINFLKFSKKQLSSVDSLQMICRMISLLSLMTSKLLDSLLAFVSSIEMNVFSTSSFQSLFWRRLRVMSLLSITYFRMLERKFQCAERLPVTQLNATNSTEILQYRMAVLMIFLLWRLKWMLEQSSKAPVAIISRYFLTSAEVFPLNIWSCRLSKTLWASAKRLVSKPINTSFYSGLMRAVSVSFLDI